jgi:diaminopimelate epimerase
MKIKFYKYQGTGNDFVMIDNRHLFFPKNNTQLIAHICNRRFGIGGDGLILLENDNLSDFKMIYYNADGNESSMCGNGGRCIVAFAKQIGLIQKETTFNAVDGLHFATINASNEVALQMISVNSIKIDEDYTFLNTGSPHHVQMVDELETFNVYEEGNKIRYSALYANGGSNVNFVNQVNQNTFRLRTYERGVEDETLSCGTGATAVAIAMFATGKTIENHIKLMVEGGELNVTFEKKGDNEYENVFLIGPATFVFEGEVIV